MSNTAAKRKIPPSHPHPPRTRTPETPGTAAPAVPAVFLTAVKSAAIGLAAGILSLLALCAVCMALDDPTAYSGILTYPALACAAVVTGILCAKKSGLGGIPSGALSGGILALLLFGLGAVVTADTAADAAAVPVLRTELLCAAGVTVLSCIGGYLTTHKRSRVKHRRRK
ncbi:MAG: hypothetical protein IJ449_00325 [Clostridia bacterium]|nr:hypothetical protein [Clostridia bacterium]